MVAQFSTLRRLWQEGDKSKTNLTYTETHCLNIKPKQHHIFLLGKSGEPELRQDAINPFKKIADNPDVRGIASFS